MIHLAAQSPRSDPLTVFMHIPKTAGSTVNSRLDRDLGAGSKRIIHLVDRPALLRWTLARATWVSGHVHFPRLDPALRAATTRDLRYMTVVRDPVSHLASHYNWYIEVYRRGLATYARYSRYQRQVSYEIRQADNTDPRAVLEILRRHHGLFLNIQTRYIVGSAVMQDCDMDMVREVLSGFAFAGRADRLGQFYSALGVRDDSEERLNASPYDFDPEVFRSPLLTKFLSRRHALDFQLWDMICAR